MPMAMLARALSLPYKNDLATLSEGTIVFSRALDHTHKVGIGT